MSGTDQVSVELAHTLAKGVKPTIDIVFIHGLGGNGSETWTHPATKAYWPALVGDTYATARVWVVRYPAELWAWTKSGAEEQSNSDGLATRILTAFGARKQFKLMQPNGPPCIWVCHSLGGIVAKRMLLAASRAIPGQADIAPDKVTGLLFLGTPHRGSNVALAGVYAEKAKALAGNALTKFALGTLDSLGWVSKIPLNLGDRVLCATNLIGELERGGDVLARLHDDFGRYYQERWAGNGTPMHVLVAAENKQSKVPPCFIVDPGSADPNLAVSSGDRPLRVNQLPLDHKEICKPPDPAHELCTLLQNLVCRVDEGADPYSEYFDPDQPLLLWCAAWQVQRSLEQCTEVYQRLIEAKGPARRAGNSPRELTLELLGDAGTLTLLRAINGFTVLLATARKAGEVNSKLVSACETIVGYLAAVIGAPALGAAHPLVQFGYVAKKPDANVVAVEAAASGHRGRPARFTSTSEGLVGRSHVLDMHALVGLDPREGKLVPRLESAVFEEIQDSETAPLRIALETKRVEQAALDDDDRAALAGRVDLLQQSGIGIAIDDRTTGMLRGDFQFLGDLWQSPLAAVVSVICQPEGGRLEAEPGISGGLPDVLRNFINEHQRCMDHLGTAPFTAKRTT